MCTMNSELTSGQRLMAESRHMGVEVKVAADKLDRLEAENAKLRELVRDMFEEIEAGGFDPMVDQQGKRGPYYEEDPSWRVGIRERVRELGIEVPE